MSRRSGATWPYFVAGGLAGAAGATLLDRITEARRRQQALAFTRELRRRGAEGAIVRGFVQDAHGWWPEFERVLTDRFGMWPEIDPAINRLARRSPASFFREVAAWVHGEIEYVPDRVSWGVLDLWQTPAETFQMGTGDCEDTALAVFWVLRMAGYRHVFLVLGSVRGPDGEPGGHAWLEVNLDGQDYLVESTTGQVYSGRPAGYRPAVFLDPEGASVT